MSNDDTATWSRLKALPRASLFLVAVIALAFVDVFTGWRPAAFIALPFLIAYFACVWSRMILNAKILLAGCAAIGIFAALQPGGIAILGAGASRMVYLPTFIALLGLLRAAASASTMIALAGRHLVNQPPSRRYLSLSFGAHFFGVLLNIGGLALLVEMVRDANTLKAAGGNERIVAWRERRMTAAALRGFSAIVFWSPLGVSFNLLLVSVPGLTWAEAGPLGILGATAFILLGWIFDQVQKPKGFQRQERQRIAGGMLAVAALIGHVAAISVATGFVERELDLSFQTALLVAVPVYAFLWALGISMASARPAPVKASAAILIDKGVAAFPGYANEIAVFAASGFLGAALVALVPQDAMRAFFHTIPLPPALFACGLCLSVAAMGQIGLNPMIGATILASAVASVDMPGLSKTAIVLAIAAGWTCSVISSPFNSSLVMTASLVNRRPGEVAYKWNGLFTLAALLLSCLVLALTLPLAR
jgi:hypothetical protein